MEQFQMDLAGRTLTIETGELAKQAGGAVMVGYGDTRGEGYRLLPTYSRL